MFQDELDSAYSLAFAIDGDRLYAGGHTTIRIFDVDRPGRQVKEIKTFGKLFFMFYYSFRKETRRSERYHLDDRNESQL